MLWERDPFFDASPKIRALYRKLAVAVRAIGPFDERPTKHAMNLVRGAVFLSVEPQAKGLRLTVKSASPLRDPRILITSHMTRTRWHNGFKLNLGEQIDGGMMEWIRQSYELCEAPSQPPPERPKPDRKQLLLRKVARSKAEAKRRAEKLRRGAPAAAKRPTPHA